MKINTILVVGVCTVFTTCLMVFAKGEVVLGVYQNDLTVYSEKGQKKGVIHVTNDEIKGSVVLDTTPRSLVQINYKGKDVWIRASQLDVKLKSQKKCPGRPPGQAPDRTTPFSSGIGGDCE